MAMRRRVSRPVQCGESALQLSRRNGRRGALPVSRSVRARVRAAPRAGRPGCCNRAPRRRALLSRLLRARDGARRTIIIDVTSRRRDGETGRGGLVFDIEANRFLHHMVRFLVGTMLDIAAGRRPLADLVDAARRGGQRRRLAPRAAARALSRVREVSGRAVRGGCVTTASVRVPSVLG